MKPSAFTLLETVIALAILGVVAGGMASVFSGSLGRVQQSTTRIEATSFAQSLLAQAELSLPLTIQTTEGSSGKLRWTIKREPYGEPTDHNAWGMTPYKLSVIVSWKDSTEKQSFTLKTLRLDE